MKKPQFKVGDEVICMNIAGDTDRNPHAVITGVGTIHYVLDFFGPDYKNMTRFIDNNRLRKISKLERAMK